jgi:hypothetical protein
VTKVAKLIRHFETELFESTPASDSDWFALSCELAAAISGHPENAVA